MTIIDQPGLDPQGEGDPPKKDPRPDHKEVDDPRKAPPAADPSIRKGPLGDPEPAVPKREIDPPVEPHIPGDLPPAMIDPAAPGAAPADPGMQL